MCYKRFDLFSNKDYGRKVSIFVKELANNGLISISGT